jgi:hypothetical protein
VNFLFIQYLSVGCGLQIRHGTGVTAKIVFLNELAPQGLCPAGLALFFFTVLSIAG